jgi:hypothetical protein
MREFILLISSKNNFKKRYLRHQKKNRDIINVGKQYFYFKNQKVKLVMANDITKQIQYIKTIENQNKSLKDIAWTHSHIVRALFKDDVNN